MGCVYDPSFGAAASSAHLNVTTATVDYNKKSNDGHGRFDEQCEFKTIPANLLCLVTETPYINYLKYIYFNARSI
jgi:hypothetical protein